MTLNNILNYVVVAFCGSFSVFIKKELALQGWQALYLPALGAILLYILFHSAIRLPLLFKPWRYLCRPESRIEGDWIEHVIKDDIRYYSLFSVNYIWKSDNYLISGIALTENGEIHAHWDSTQIKYDEDQLELRYFHISKQHGKMDLPGFTRLSFFRPSKGEVEDGEGYFVDMDEHPIRCDFSFRRVNPQLIKDVINSKSIRIKREHRELFIQNYHKQQKRISQ